MKILYTSDTHWGITKEKSIRKLFQNIAKEEFDVFLHLGDYCGTHNGFKPTRATIKLFREIVGDVPYVTVIGNHDYWLLGDRRRNSVYGGSSYGYASLSDWIAMQEDMLKMFEHYNVHFIDHHGLYQHPDFENIILTGHSGWYGSHQPPTNDYGHLPLGIEGDTHRYMQRQVQIGLESNLDQLREVYDPGYHTVLFCSHFPVVNSVADYKGSFSTFCWSEDVYIRVQAEFDCNHFICGHAHKSCDGPLRYEAGSDYHNPKYKILEL